MKYPFKFSRYFNFHLFQTPGLCFEDAFTEKVTISHHVLKPYTNMTIMLNVSIDGRDVESGSDMLKVIYYIS